MGPSLATERSTSAALKVENCAPPNSRNTSDLLALKSVNKSEVLREFGGAQFSTFKAALVDLSVAKLGPIGAEMKKLVQDPVYIDSILADGSQRAQTLAAETMKAVKDIVGFVRA